MGQIYKNGKKYGGFFTGPANDVSFINVETIFKGNNVQEALSEISDMFEPGDDSTGSLENISIGTNPETSNLALVVKWKLLGDNETKTNYIDFTN